MLHATLKDFGFKVSIEKPRLCVFDSDGDTLYCMLWYMLVASCRHPRTCVRLHVYKVDSILKRAFVCRDLGEAKTYLGIDIVRDRAATTHRDNYHV